MGQSLQENRYTVIFSDSSTVSFCLGSGASSQGCVIPVRFKAFKQPITVTNQIQGPPSGANQFIVNGVLKQRQQTPCEVDDFRTSRVAQFGDYLLMHSEYRLMLTDATSASTVLDFASLLGDPILVRVSQTF